MPNSFKDENRVYLSGRLTQDTSLKYTKTKIPVLRFTLAVNTYVKDKKETLFIPIVVYGDLALEIASFVKQGTPVKIEGRLVNRVIEIDGEKHKFIEVIAHKVEIYTKDSSVNQQK
ncbi:MAG: single-stranded DNA-binding protein [Elusimicrobiota bacterium]|nr:single-stranded DNA-binding protein [Endomicrobiia bacterium]MCX7910282.1 single-stranded DNA-binding protein [Endomicrobiia bacterium]MDW8165786.1 single-stranded DNA-binding protein [Elusimicrobiota bacterium]